MGAGVGAGVGMGLTDVAQEVMKIARIIRLNFIFYFSKPTK